MPRQMLSQAPPGPFRPNSWRRCGGGVVCTDLNNPQGLTQLGGARRYLAALGVELVESILASTPGCGKEGFLEQENSLDTWA